MQLKAAILSAFLAIAPASAHLRNVHDKNNKNGATTIDDEAALRNHITSWIDELKDSTAANNDSRRLDSDPHCVAVKNSAATILASAMEGCGTAASGPLGGGFTNEKPNPTCLLLLCEAHFKATEIVTPECKDENPDFDRSDILACRLTPGYLPPETPTANNVTAGTFVGEQLDVVITGTIGQAHILDNVNGTFGFDLELQEEIVTQAQNGTCTAFSGTAFGEDFGKVIYVPDDGFLGKDSCEYKVCYAEGTRYADVCSTAFVNAEVVAQPTSSPTAAPTFGCDITLELPKPHIPLVSQSKCVGKLTELTLKYNGGDCTQSNNEQGGKFECEDFNGGPTDADVEITVSDKNGILLQEDSVSVGENLMLVADKFESEIIIEVRDPQDDIAPANDDKGTGDDDDMGLLQKITIHTSCSQDLRLLDIFGSTQVFAYTDTDKDGPVTVVQPVTVSGGLVNNNDQCIVKDKYTLSFEDSVLDINFNEAKCSEDQSFVQEVETDLSQESLEYTLDFEGKLKDFPGQVCDETIDVSVSNRNLGPSLTELVASLPEFFSTLQTALELTGLDEVLDGPGRFTVFAPTNEAFAALDPEVFAALVAEDPPNTLKRVLLYHVARPDVESKDLSNGQAITTVEGADVAVTINDDGIFINQAEVINADNLANNGVAHIIDAVLIYPGFEVPAASTEEDV